MSLRAFFVALWLLSGVAYGQERLALPASATPIVALSPWVELGRPAFQDPQERRYLEQRMRWRLISGGVLLLGTSTLLTGVHLFNNGNNAKKNAAGDLLINVGLGVDLAALAPLGVSLYWGHKLRR